MRAAAIVLLLLAGPALAEPQLDPRSQLQADVAATAQPARVEFLALFTLPEAREAYLKVSPSPGNPVFGNGTAGSGGWWTGVELHGPDGLVLTATTTGDPPVELGRLEANTTYELRLGVHAPAGALRDGGPRTMEYVLAERSPPAAGSGGSLDRSVALRLTAMVEGQAEAAEPVPGTPPWVWPAVVGTFAAVALAAWAWLGLRSWVRSRARSPRKRQA